MATIGVDFASVDGNNLVDLYAAKQAGVRFAIVRGVYGRPVRNSGPGPFLDPEWRTYKDALKVAGIKRSAYLFICYEKRGVYTPSADEQAQAFINYVQLEPFEDMVPFIDVEEASDVLSADEMYDWTLRIALKLRDHYDAWPGIYTSARVWSENLKHHSPGPLLNCPLWLAKPWPWAIRTPIHLDGAPTYSPTLIPEFGDAWSFYQYQGDATKCPGFDSTVDANRARMFGKGSRGRQVAWMQQRLGITADGIFGPNTDAAVRAFQSQQGLTADGIVGLNTFTPLCWLRP